MNDKDKDLAMQAIAIMKEMSEEGKVNFLTLVNEKFSEAFDKADKENDESPEKEKEEQANKEPEKMWPADKPAMKYDLSNVF